jgi:hypothetical protein
MFRVVLLVLFICAPAPARTKIHCYAPGGGV